MLFFLFTFQTVFILSFIGCHQCAGGLTRLTHADCIVVVVGRGKNHSPCIAKGKKCWESVNTILIFYMGILTEWSVGFNQYLIKSSLEIINTSVESEHWFLSRTRKYLKSLGNGLNRLISYLLFESWRVFHSFVMFNIFNVAPLCYMQRKTYFFFLAKKAFTVQHTIQFLGLMWLKKSLSLRKWLSGRKWMVTLL